MIEPVYSRYLTGALATTVRAAGPSYSFASAPLAAVRLSDRWSQKRLLTWMPSGPSLPQEQDGAYSASARSFWTAPLLKSAMPVIVHCCWILLLYR